MGVCVPEEHGGAGADFLSYILVLEQLSRADAGIGVTVAVHTSAATLPILTFGTDEQKARFVPPLAAGETLGAFALTEPDSGSDAASLRTTAVSDGDGWRLTGSKQWITNGAHADAIVLFARTDPATQGARGVTAFVVGQEHVEVTHEAEKLGLHSSSTVDLRLDGARRGATGCCTRSARDSPSRWRPSTEAGSGSRRRPSGSHRPRSTWRAPTRLERRQFGRRIADHQAIQFKLADMATEIDAARLLTYRAAWLKQSGLPHSGGGGQGQAVRLRDARGGRPARRSRSSAATAIPTEFAVERYYRDAKITEIYEGTSEIQRMVIARNLLADQERALAPA